MVIQTSCPICQQSISADTQVCPHCQAQLTPLANTIIARPIGQSSAPQKQEEEPPSNDALTQIDSSASTIISTAGILMGLNSGAIFAGKVQGIALLFAIIYASPLAFLLLTIIMASRVFYTSGHLIKNREVLFQKKYDRLRYSAFMLTISVIVLAISVCVYLTRPAH